MPRTFMRSPPWVSIMVGDLIELLYRSSETESRNKSPLGGCSATRKEQTRKLSVHGSIPHHEREIKHLQNLASVRPEVSKGEGRLNPSCRTASCRDFARKVPVGEVLYDA